MRWSSTPGSGTGDAVRILLLLNGILFLALRLRAGSIVPVFGLVPHEAWSQGRVWQFFTYAFLHQGLLHLVCNMAVLWSFGNELEALWGFGPFLRFYSVTAVGAGLFHTLVTPHSMIPTIGASGAIAGLVTAYAVLFPDRELYFLLFFIIPVRMRAKTLAVLIVASSLALGAAGSPDGIAHFAHLGGCVAGFLYLRALRTPFRPLEWWRSFRLKRRLSVVRRRTSGGGAADEADRVLDRANAVGFDRLTDREREVLDSASRRLRGKGRR
jgi:membrane associated rhomboid family serine protease